MVTAEVVKINKREFQRHVSKYLKVGMYRVAVSDKNVEIEPLSEIVSDTLDTVEEVKTFIAARDNDPMVYGCGCVKEGGKVLCKKHQRV